MYKNFRIVNFIKNKITSAIHRVQFHIILIHLFESVCYFYPQLYIIIFVNSKYKYKYNKYYNRIW